MKVKIAIAQLSITPGELKTNCEKIAKYFARAAKHKCDFICLPEECWVGPGYDEDSPNEVAKFVKTEVAQLCKKYRIYCVAGTVMEVDAKSALLHNVCYLFDKNGRVVGSYAKRHPVPGSESSSPGNKHTVLETEFGLVGIQICRDILYPEVTSTMANMGAKIIFSPAFWSKYSTAYASSLKKYHHNDELVAIKYLVPARSFENEVFFVFTNAAKHFKTTKREDYLLGYSQICSPFVGPMKVIKHNREKLLISEIELDEVQEMRSSWRIRKH
jgi:predicted amidohydrolase